MSVCMPKLSEFSNQSSFFSRIEHVAADGGDPQHGNQTGGGTGVCVLEFMNNAHVQEVSVVGTCCGQKLTERWSNSQGSS